MGLEPTYAVLETTVLPIELRGQVRDYLYSQIVSREIYFLSATSLGSSKKSA